MLKKLWIVFIVIITKFNFVNAQSNCYGPITYTVDHQPIANQYPPGTVVNICVTMVGYTSYASLWFEGFTMSFGTGWLASSTVPTLAPNQCSNAPNGNWIWVNSFNVNGFNFGPGYFFDLNNNGLSQDDYGDQGSCTWTYCFSVIVGNNFGAPLTLGVITVSDGTAGSWGGGTSCLFGGVQIFGNTTVVGQPCAINGSVTNITNVNCFNDSNGTFTLQANGGAPPFTYAIDSMNFSQNPTFENLYAGNYVAMITDSFGCTVQVPIEITQPLAPFSVNVSPNSDTSFCQGSNIQLVTDSSGVYSYQWFLNGNSISNANTFNLMLDSAGTYSVLVTNENNCTASSNSIEVTQINLPVINQAPSDTIITENANAFFVVSTSVDSLNNFTYQWQENNGAGFVNLINSNIYNGVNNDSLIINNVSLNFDSLQYQCLVSNSNCTTVSNVANLFVTELTEMNNLKIHRTYFTIYPNPTCNNITIEISENLIGNHVHIYNAIGQVVLAQNINQTKEVIDISVLSKGIYFIKLNGDSAVQKLIIE